MSSPSFFEPCKDAHRTTGYQNNPRELPVSFAPDSRLSGIYRRSQVFDRLHRSAFSSLAFAGTPTFAGVYRPRCVSSSMAPLLAPRRPPLPPSVSPVAFNAATRNNSANARRHVRPSTDSTILAWLERPPPTHRQLCSHSVRKNNHHLHHQVAVYYSTAPSPKYVAHAAFHR